MKALLRSLVLLLVAAPGFPAALQAQAAKNAYLSSGTMSLQFTQAFTNSLKKQGIVVRYIDNEGSSIPDVAALQIEGGIVDLKNGSSEVQSEGGVMFSAGGNDVQLQRFALESIGQQSAHLTAYVILNGKYVGRKAVFTVTGGQAFAPPLEYGKVMSGKIHFEVNPTFLTQVNDYFQTSVSYTGDIGDIKIETRLEKNP